MKLKKYLLLILLNIVVCVCVTSCSDDDNDITQDGISNILVGEWDSEFLGDANEVNIENLNVNDTHLESIDSRLVFNVNGAGYEIDLYDNVRTDFSYTINGNILRMSAGNISQTHKIIKYSENVVYSLMEGEESIFKMVKRK